MKKKFVPSSKDKKDWMSFTQNMENISAKEIDQIQEIGRSNKIPKIDLYYFNPNWLIINKHSGTYINNKYYKLLKYFSKKDPCFIC